MRINYNEIKVKGVRKWKENGKTRQETKTFWQTVTPFNRDENGNVKTREQILREVIQERDEWLKSKNNSN